MKTPFAPDSMYLSAREIIHTLRQAGHEAYIAGGAVRDHLLGRSQVDLDIATSATPQQVRALFRSTFAVGESFGVVIVRSRGRSFEVATFREEQDYQDGRHPATVRFSTARADVARRDFTINGMLWDTEREEVLDWVGGREDIARRCIRTIGDPAERFAEDRLRMLRALRFAAQLDFELEPSTLSAIRSQAGQLPVVSLERVRLELDKLLAANGAGRGLDLLRDSELWKTLRDWLRREALRLARPAEFSLGDVDTGDWSRAWLAWRAASPANPSTSEPLPGLLCLLLDVAGLPPEGWSPATARPCQACLEALTRALRGSRNDVATARAAARLVALLGAFSTLRLADQLRALRLPEAAWLLPVARFHPDFKEGPFEFIDELVARHRERWHPQPLLDGLDLMEQGVPAGPLVGELLEELESQQLEGHLQTRMEAQDWLAGILASQTVTR